MHGPGVIQLLSLALGQSTLFPFATSKSTPSARDKGSLWQACSFSSELKDVWSQPVAICLSSLHLPSLGNSLLIPWWSERYFSKNEFYLVYGSSEGTLLLLCSMDTVPFTVPRLKEKTKQWDRGSRSEWLLQKTVWSDGQRGQPSCWCAQRKGIWVFFLPLTKVGEKESVSNKTHKE